MLHQKDRCKANSVSAQHVAHLQSAVPEGGGNSGTRVGISNTMTVWGLDRPRYRRVRNRAPRVNAYQAGLASNINEFLLAIDVTSSGTPEEKLKWAFRMYDVDGNGVIDIQEMTKIVQAIYDMLGACSSNRPADSAEERAKNIFARMDENNDGQLTEEEFLKGCLQDEELSKMLAP
ncbi:Neuronal calcium sensor 2 [Eufriesea mexicana]|nr:Neuronal calcium sensor 2 [Eufriesea mexicana]